MTTAHARSHRAWAALVAMLDRPPRVELMGAFEPARSGSAPALIAAQLRTWRAMREAMGRIVVEATPDLIIVMDGDALDRVAALFGRPFQNVSSAWLLIHTKFHWPAIGIGQGGRFRAIAALVLKRLLTGRDVAGVLTIDPLLVTALPARVARGGRLRYVPDPGEVRSRPDPRSARARFELDPERYTVLVYGGIGPRKNVDRLLDAACASASRPQVLIAGEIDAGLGAGLQTRVALCRAVGVTVAIEGRFIDRDDEANAFAAADVVWVGYRRDFEGQSAVLALAASASRPILGADHGWIGRLVRAHRLGLSIDPDDTSRAARALDRLVDPAIRHGYRAALAEFAASRSEQAYAAAWIAALNAWLPPGLSLESIA